MWSHDYQVETCLFSTDRGSCKSSDPDRQPWGISPDKEGNGELLPLLCGLDHWGLPSSPAASPRLFLPTPSRMPQWQ